ncbi:type VI secretion system baseplate subunit TssE [Pseudomonas fluorescens]|uniref:Type VI secretion system baseplate subunit TssE n=1 Tax=Pseudomonas fluorescens TaxID=294 RepID=A0A327MUL2_PSEFL|nr:type VI secretion system baseplate subunit TssE [Pseudomonas fluorescens]RAI65524.1 type VI secretion system baseplate subunit TssE [Pseudomonas fluorescens]
MPELNPSLYETLLQNFDGDLELSQVSEEDQHTLSVLENVQRILNSRAGTLAHLPDYGLPDMGVILEGLPASAQGLMRILQDTLIKYEPRLAAVSIELLPQVQPGHLEYALEAQLMSGGRVAFGTTLAAQGKVVVRHLKQRNWLS